MPAARGFLSKLGIAEETVWGTPLPVTELVLLRSSNLKESSTPIPAETLTGKASATFESVGPVVATGRVETRMAYLDPTVANPSILLKHGTGEQVGTIYRNVVNESWEALRFGASDNVELAQAVTVPGTGSKTVQSVRLLLRRRGVLTSGNLAVEIQGDAAGAPDGSPITNGTSVNALVTSVTTDDFGQWLTFVFAVAPVVTGGTLYHLVLTGTYTADASNHVEIGTEDVASAGGFEILDASWSDLAVKNMNARWYMSTSTDTFLLTDDLETLGLTFAEDKASAGIFEYAGGKISKWELTGSPETGVLFGADVVCKERNASPVNTAALLAALLNTNSPMPFTDLVVWVGDQADVLTAADAQSLASIRCSVNWDMDQVNTNAGRFILEPLNSMRVTDFEFVLPRFNTAQFHIWQKSGTKLQMRWHWTNNSRFFTLNFPEVILLPDIDAAIQGAGPLQLTIRGQAFRNLSNRVMHVPDELELTLTNV